MRVRRIMVGLVCLGWLPVAVAQPPNTLYETLTKTATSTTAQTDTALWTPVSGNYFVLMGCLMSAIKPVKIDVEVSDVDVFAPVYLESYGLKLISGGGVPIYVSAKDAVLRYTTSTVDGSSFGQQEFSITCWGYEVRE